MRYISYCTHQLQSLSAWKHNLPAKIIEKDLIFENFSSTFISLYVGVCMVNDPIMFMFESKSGFNCPGGVTMTWELLCNSLMYSDQYPGMIMKIVVMMPGT